MKFDEYGLPRVTGASDKQDSAAVAGMMAAFGLEGAPPLFAYLLLRGKEIPDRDDPTKMHKFDKHIYVRHPKEYKYDLSRDQWVLLIAGMAKQGLAPEFIDIKFVNGKDFMSPSVRGHERRCKGKKAFFWQDWVLRLDMWYSWKYKPMEELNQLLTILWLHPDDKYILKYCEKNPQWADSLEKYWFKGYINAEGKVEGNWRGEEQFCAQVIAKIRARLEAARGKKVLS